MQWRGLCCLCCLCGAARLPRKSGLPPRPLQGTALLPPCHCPAASLPPSTVELAALDTSGLDPAHVPVQSGRLRAQLERADRRGMHWRLKQEPQPAGSADRVAAMRGELQLLELTVRLRERLADQNEAQELLEVEERALARRLREALENRRAS